MKNPRRNQPRARRPDNWKHIGIRRDLWKILDAEGQRRNLSTPAILDEKLRALLFPAQPAPAAAQVG